MPLYGYRYEAGRRTINACISTDYDIIIGLQKDRRIYKKVVEKLTDQIKSSGQVPVTDYDTEVMKTK